MCGAGNDCRQYSRERIRADRASRRRGRRASARRKPFHRVPARPVRRFNRRRLFAPPTDNRHRSSHAVYLWGSARHHLSGPVTLPASRQCRLDGVCSSHQHRALRPWMRPMANYLVHSKSAGAVHARRHQVVIVGCGFGGLFAAKTLRARRCRHHRHRPDEPPPVSAAALSARDGDSLRGGHRAADPRRPSAPAEHARRAWRSRGHRSRRPPRHRRHDWSAQSRSPTTA